MKELEDPNSKEVLLLIKECGLAATSIDQGLIALRKANFATKGLYYQSFFLLSIGIERLLKIIIIVKNLVEKDTFPDNYELKNHGHGIIGMFKQLSQELCPQRNFLKENDLFEPILKFITDYAHNSRYFNLDTLSGGKTEANDPIHEWHSIQQIIRMKHCKNKDFSDYEKYIIESLANHSKFHYTTEADIPIEDAYQYFEEAKYLDKIQGYSVWYFYQIIDYLVSMLLKEADKKMMLPYYYEFFPLFNNSYMNKKQILKRKQWDYFTNPR